MADSPRYRKRGKHLLGMAGEGQFVEELRRKGVDIEFVRWLEGTERRLPYFDAVHKLSYKQLAGAIRGAAMLLDGLEQASALPAGDKQQFELLEQFLWDIARSSAQLSTRTHDLAQLP